MNTIPSMYYRLFTLDAKGTAHLFETNQFGEPNNWFESIDQAAKWIKEVFDDAYPTGSVDPAALAPPQLVLVALPVWLLNFRPIRLQNL
jgi:hypothetical protein